MEILSATYDPKLQQTVNSLGKYMFKNLPGAVNYEKVSNMYNIRTLVLYQIPYDLLEFYGIEEDKYKDVYEMIINISITTYDSKIRVNLIEEDPEELTLGHKTFDTKGLNKSSPRDYFEMIKNKVWAFLVASLERRYEGYDFLF